MDLSLDGAWPPGCPSDSSEQQGNIHLWYLDFDVLAYRPLTDDKNPSTRVNMAMSKGTKAVVITFSSGPSMVAAPRWSNGTTGTTRSGKHWSDSRRTSRVRLLSQSYAISVFENVRA